MKTTPITKADTPFAAVFKFDVFSSTTTAIVLAIIVSLIVYRVKGKMVKELMIETMKELKAPVYTICSVIALAYVETTLVCHLHLDLHSLLLVMHSQFFLQS